MILKGGVLGCQDLCFLFERFRTVVLIILHSSSNHFSLVFFGFLYDDFFFKLHIDGIYL